MGSCYPSKKKLQPQRTISESQQNLNESQIDLSDIFGELHPTREDITVSYNVGDQISQYEYHWPIYGDVHFCTHKTEKIKNNTKIQKNNKNDDDDDDRSHDKLLQTNHTNSKNENENVYENLAVTFVDKCDLVSLQDSSKLKDDYYNIINHVRKMDALNHRNILSKVDFLETDEKAYIITPFHDGGYLSDKLQKLDEKNIKCVMRKLLSAVEYMHSMNIKHNDLKAENILFNDGQIVICGLESADFMENANTQTADAFQIGIIMYSLFGGVCDDEYGINLDEMFNGNKYPQWNGVTIEAKNLIKGLLSHDDSKKINCSTALQNIWFSDIIDDHVNDKDIAHGMIAEDASDHKKNKKVNDYKNKEKEKVAIVDNTVNEVDGDGVSDVSEKTQLLTNHKVSAVKRVMIVADDSGDSDDHDGGGGGDDGIDEANGDDIQRDRGDDVSGVSEKTKLITNNKVSVVERVMIVADDSGDSNDNNGGIDEVNDDDRDDEQGDRVDEQKDEGGIFGSYLYEISDNDSIYKNE